MRIRFFIYCCCFLGFFSCKEVNKKKEQKKNHKEDIALSLSQWFYRNNKNDISDTLKLYIGKTECGEWGGSNRVIFLTEGKGNIDVLYRLYDHDCDSMHLIDEYTPQRIIDSTFTLNKLQETAVIRFMTAMMEDQFIDTPVSNGENRYGISHGERFYLYKYGSTDRLHETGKNLLTAFGLEPLKN